MRHDAASNDDLSAYLDDALDAEARARFESDLSQDPRLAEELRALSVIRELVGSLPRPAIPGDLSARVVARIEARRSPHVWTLSLSRVRDAWPTLASGLKIAAVAAALLALASLPVTLPRFLERGNNPPALAHVAPRVVRQSPRAPINEPTPPVIAENSADPDQTDAREAAASVVASAALKPDPREIALDQENEKFRRLLDSPSLGKVFVVSDRDGADPALRVDWLLHDSPRRYPNYARISLVPELNPNPDRPGAAAVYAVVMDEREVERLHADLSSAFPFGSIEEKTPRPELVTRLADAGQVEVFEGTAVADLLDFRADTQASKVPRDSQIQLHPRQVPLWLPPEMTSRLLDPTDAEFSVDPRGSRRGQIEPDDAPTQGASTERSPVVPKAEPTPPLSVDRPSRAVVLIWVSRPSPIGVIHP